MSILRQLVTLITPLMILSLTHHCPPCSLPSTIGNPRNTILADLISRDIEFAHTIGSYRPLASAVVNDPRCGFVMLTD